MRSRDAIRLVARREVVERGREKGFLIGIGVSVAIIALVAVLPPLLGLGGRDTFKVAAADRTGAAVIAVGARLAPGFDARLTVVHGRPALGDVDAVVSATQIRARDEPDDNLVALLQTAGRQVQARAALQRAGVASGDADRVLSPRPLGVSTARPPDESRDKRGGFAFFASLLLYGQLISLGFLVASGVVEEKASRVVEVLLATVRPRELLAGKVLGLGVLGLAQLLTVALVGLAIAGASGALTIDGDVLVAAALALAWFVVGYAFYAALFAVAGALVPRQEELQSATTPITLLLLVSFFLSFTVQDDPSGPLATVASFLPPAAPISMPARIALGEASTVEVLGAFALTLAAAAALVPLAGRIYSGAVLRTGSAVKLRDAWRAART